jgi:dipeptidyl aminopeptidase/acylaminoacyl peptidase
VGSPQLLGDKILIGRDDLKNPVELYSVRPDGSDLRKLTNINKELVDQLKMGDAEQFRFSGWNNEQVYGYVVKPVDFDSSKIYPVAFLIHGGPQGSFGNHFHYRWNPQAYSGAGYAVVMIDFHGSVGYGQEFTDSISGDWGGKPLEDLQKGLAAAIDKYSWLDGERVGALGASYGGYMINWIAGNWPDRFRCLVNHDGTFDQRMMYYATEELWFPEWEFGGTSWENPTLYRLWSPHRHAANFRTPMLIIHGEQDFRVPPEQGLIPFTTLRRKGVDTRLLYFPNEGHWVQNEKNSELWHKVIREWLDKYLQP